MPVFINGAPLSPTLPASTRRRLEPLALAGAAGRRRADQVVALLAAAPESRARRRSSTSSSSSSTICSATPGSEPWDYWLQCLRQNDYDKLPLSEFCQVRAAAARRPAAADATSCIPGTRREIARRGAAPPRRTRRSAFLPSPTRTISSRYNTRGDHRGLSSRPSARRRRGPGHQGLRRLLRRHDDPRARSRSGHAVARASSTSASSPTSAS